MGKYLFSVLRNCYLHKIPIEVLSISPSQHQLNCQEFHMSLCILTSLLLTEIISKSRLKKKSAMINNFKPCNGLGNEVILSGLLNPRKDACNCHRIRIIKLFINLLKARVVTKPSSCAVAFIPYVYLAQRPNPHSFLTHNCSQFSVCTALSAHQPHLPGCYNSSLGLLPNLDPLKAVSPNTRIQTKIHIANVKCHLQGLFHPIISVQKNIVNPVVVCM